MKDYEKLQKELKDTLNENSILKQGFLYKYIFSKKIYFFFRN